MLIENAATYYSSLYFQSLMLLKNHPHTVPNFFLHQFINKWTYIFAVLYSEVSKVYGTGYLMSVYNI